MYFINSVHENNYNFLMELYELTPGESVQYQASLYIAALPELYKAFANDIIPDGGGTPLVHFLKWNDELGRQEVSHAALTGSTKRLVEFGMSLYNGFPCDLDALAGSATSHGYPKAIQQALAIRMRIE